MELYIGRCLALQTNENAICLFALLTRFFIYYYLSAFTHLFISLSYSLCYIYTEYTSLPVYSHILIYLQIMQ